MSQSKKVKLPKPIKIKKEKIEDDDDDLNWLKNVWKEGFVYNKK